MTEKNKIYWKCACGFENFIKVPCAMPLVVECKTCKKQYHRLSVKVSYIGDKGEDLVISADQM